MKFTKETLKRIIKEELAATLREGSWNDQLGGRIGNPYGGDKVSLVRSLNNAMNSLQPGSEPEEVAAAQETLARVKEEMSPEDFKIAEKLAKRYVYYQNYATDMDYEMIEKQMERMCIELGITLDDII